MSSLARKIARSQAKAAAKAVARPTTPTTAGVVRDAQGSMTVAWPPTVFGQGDSPNTAPAPVSADQAATDLTTMASCSVELAALIRAGVRAMGGLYGPMDVVVPVVHVESTDYRAHFGVPDESIPAVLSRHGYLSGLPRSVDEVVAALPWLASEIRGEQRDGRRARPDRQGLLLFCHADGAAEAVWFDLAEARRGGHADRSELVYDEGDRGYDG